MQNAIFEKAGVVPAKPSEPLNLPLPATREGKLKRIGEIVRSTREGLGLERSSLASISGLAVNTLRNVEEGSFAPRLSTAQRLRHELSLGEEFDSLVRSLNQDASEIRSRNISKASAARWKGGATTRKETKSTDVPINAPPLKPKEGSPLSILGSALVERALVIGLEQLEEELKQSLARVQQARQGTNH